MWAAVSHQLLLHPAAWCFIAVAIETRPLLRVCIACYRIRHKYEWHEQPTVTGVCLSDLTSVLYKEVRLMTTLFTIMHVIAIMSQLYTCLFINQHALVAPQSYIHRRMAIMQTPHKTVNKTCWIVCSFAQLKPSVHRQSFILQLKSALFTFYFLHNDSFNHRPYTYSL